MTYTRKWRQVLKSMRFTTHRLLAVYKDARVKSICALIFRVLLGSVFAFECVTLGSMFYLAREKLQVHHHVCFDKQP